MTIREALIHWMQINHVSMEKLAERVGYKNKSAVSKAITDDGMHMKISTLLKLLDEMDCSLVITTYEGDEFVIDGVDEGVDYKRNLSKDWC